MKNPNKQGGSAAIPAIVFLLCLLVSICVALGWVMNIIHIVREVQANSFTLKTVLEVAGIPTLPLGALLGWVL